MAFIKTVRSYFFRNTAPINTNVEGNRRDNFNTGGAPSQDTMERFATSSPFFTEAGDRAKLNTAGPIANEVGLVAITTDTKAKANISGLESDRTLVTHGGQLPTVEATENQTVGALTDNLLEVTVDAATTTRNNFLLRLKGTFVTWLDTLRTNVNTNTANIATNTSNISTNTANITNLQTSADINALVTTGWTSAGLVLGTNVTNGARPLQYRRIGNSTNGFLVEWRGYLINSNTGQNNRELIATMPANITPAVSTVGAMGYGASAGGGAQTTPYRVIPASNNFSITGLSGSGEAGNDFIFFDEVKWWV